MNPFIFHLATALSWGYLLFPDENPTETYLLSPAVFVQRRVGPFPSLKGLFRTSVNSQVIICNLKSENSGTDETSPSQMTSMSPTGIILGRVILRENLETTGCL